MVTALVPLLLLGSAGAASAASTGGSCGAAASGWERVTFEGWWDKTVDVGFGGDLDAAVTTLAPLLGTDPTESAVHDAIVAGVVGLDRNGNGALCWKDLPTTPGLPPFLFGARDDATSSGG